MEQLSIDNLTLDESLDEILAEKTYNPDTNSLSWMLLSRYIIRRIFDIIKSEFENDIETSEVEHPITKQKETLKEMCTRICSQLLKAFPNSPPFTILRLAELIKEPTKYYKKSHTSKFLYAVETLVYVESSVDDHPRVQKYVSSSNAKKHGRSQTIEMEPIEWLQKPNEPNQDTVNEEASEIEGEANTTEEAIIDSYSGVGEDKKGEDIEMTE